LRGWSTPCSGLIRDGPPAETADTLAPAWLLARGARPSARLTALAIAALIPEEPPPT